MNKCDYDKCEEEIVSGGNILFDEDGDDYHIGLCKKHLDKMIKDTEELENGE